MYATVEGIFRNGKIQLTEIPEHVIEDTPVIVTFLNTRYVDLRDQGIGETQAADLRASFATFAEDWDRPEMDIYDEYESAKANL